MQTYNVNNHVSRASLLNCGVPQESIIDPPIFLIYINDLPAKLFECGHYADGTNVTFTAAAIPDLESYT